MDFVMRLILMGTGPFAVPSFQSILKAGVEVVYVVTRPVVATSAKKEPPPSPVRQWAIDNQLPIADPISINEAETVQWLASLSADLMVVCDYGQILSRDALSATKLGGINLHGSLLPKHRGAAPVQWSILSGDSIAGVSIIHMTPALDGGPVLIQSSTEIGVAETAAELEARLSQIGVQATLDSIATLATKHSLEDCAELGQKQEKALATKAPRLAKEDGELNLFYPVRWIDRLIRGLQPWPSTFAHVTFPDSKTLRIIVPHATPIEMNLASQAVEPGDLLFGETLRKFRESDPRLNGALYAVAQDGLMELPNVQPAGKRLMSSEEFVRGYARYTSMKITCSPGSHRLLNKMTCT
jgi:methionyl-tRNA formyltransferase